MSGYNTRRGGSTHPQLSVNERMPVNVHRVGRSAFSSVAPLSIPATLGTMQEELEPVGIRAIGPSSSDRGTLTLGGGFRLAQPVQVPIFRATALMVPGRNFSLLCRI